MFNFASSLRIYLSVEPTDMRKSFNGLYAIAKHELERNPMDGSLFVFANRRRDRVKLLYWDGSGFWVLAKRLEKGTFWWPGLGEVEAGGLEIKPEALSMLLNGIDLKAGSLRAWFCR
ncbi:MAG: IS66 family insertion sequence element accessory protein TnpB [Halomonas sp.]|nr:IS66 family insertion sequence element accessory protein TnpB [Halomonas sp.]TVM04555.1 MAG: IS66 family insertion sequence element accessory protein TnpB [Halomonas sp.]